MATLQSYVETILRNAPALGEVMTPTAAAATTITVGGIAGIYENDHFNRDAWLWRPNASTPATNRLKGVSDYVGSTGVFTIRGSDYDDTTITNEALFVVYHRPQIYIDAINRVLHKLANLDAEIIPGYGRSTVPLGTLPWILGEGHIENVYWRYSRMLSRNSDFRKWNDIDSSGALTPDDWTLTGASATMARNTSIIERGISPYSVAVTRAGTDCYIGQIIAWQSGVSGDSLQGETVTLYARARASVASQVRLRMVETLSDGTTVTTNTSFHSGGGQFEELTSSLVTVNANTVSIEIQGRVEGNNTVVYFSRLGLLWGSIDDSARREDYDAGRSKIPRRYWRYSQMPPALVLPYAPTWGTQIQVEAWRPFFDATTRLSADGDSCDAPEEVVALGAIAVIYRTLAESSSGDVRAEHLLLAEDYDRRYQRVARARALEPDHGRIYRVPGAAEPSLLAPYARRVG